MMGWIRIPALTDSGLTAEGQALCDALPRTLAGAIPMGMPNGSYSLAEAAPIFGGDVGHTTLDDILVLFF
jgi:hypothetical protein